MELQLVVITEDTKKDQLDLNILPVINKEFTLSKPKGGFWTSTYTPHDKFPSDWVRFCKLEADWEIKHAWILEVDPNAHIYEIDSYEDLDRLLQRYPRKTTYKFELPCDWEKLSKDYDGVHLTSRGEALTRYTNPHNLYGWDCECTLWFRNVFTQVTPINLI